MIYTFKNWEMKTILKIIVVFIGITTVAFQVVGSGTNDHERFLRGAWKAKEGALKYIEFMESGMVKIVSRRDDGDIAMQMHYRVSDYNEERKTFEIAFLQKDLYRDHFDLKKTLKFTYQNDNSLIFHSEKSGRMVLTRAFRGTEYR